MTSSLPIRGGTEQSSSQHCTRAAETTTEIPAADATPTIAVLPFVNMSEEPGNEYFADGLSEELLNMLVKLPGLRVAAPYVLLLVQGLRVEDLRDRR